MAGFETELEALHAADASVIAASIDDEEKAGEVAGELSFPVAHGVTRANADALGSWWEDRRGIIQPSEFIVSGDGKVVASSYSSGPIGRIDAADALKLIKLYASRS